MIIITVDTNNKQRKGALAPFLLKNNKYKNNVGGFREPRGRQIVKGDTVIAHVRKNKDETFKIQSLEEHLEGVSHRTRAFTSKLGLSDIGELLGLLHDLGKYSSEFQKYIKSSSGFIDPDSDDYVETGRLRGHIDHSTAGGQHIYRLLADRGSEIRRVAELLALALVSHHSGLIDGLSPDGTNRFAERMTKPDEKTHLEEILATVDKTIYGKIEGLVQSEATVAGVAAIIEAINATEKQRRIQVFQYGMLAKFLFSALIDADRLDSADFESPDTTKERSPSPFKRWTVLLKRLEAYLGGLEERNCVDGIRCQISMAAAAAGTRTRGAYTLTVPTGGGKTLASLRFALSHAAEHELEHIVYIVPYTSIIEQNAAQVREVLETGHPEDEGRIVLEQHSNLRSERDTWLNKLLAEDWDAPIVFTTSVQILEAMFAKSTRGTRRLHQLGKSVLIFDEVQTLPINCIHLFNNAVNFLVDHCGSTVVLCTATQPLLDRVDETKGVLRLVAEGGELMPHSRELFADLARVKVEFLRRAGGWTCAEVAGLAATELPNAGSVLIVVNTKRNARNIFEALKHERIDSAVLYHLSTSMCPAHRKHVLDEVKKKLSVGEAVICVSTQLIEAGVDVDFGSVIRALAGLDSMAQAAGRCNRNGRREYGKVYIVDLAEENLASLREIEEGKRCALRVLDEYDENPAPFRGDPIGPEAMELYYRYYFWNRRDRMDYPVGASGSVGRPDTLLRLLSTNGSPQAGSLGEYWRQNGHNEPELFFRQSFMSAAEAFKAIDAPTEGLLVPWGRGAKLSTLFNSGASTQEKRELLREAQHYSVNLRQSELNRIRDEGLLHEIEEIGILELKDERYYSEDFGLSDEAQSRLRFQGG